MGTLVEDEADLLEEGAVAVLDVGPNTDLPLLAAELAPVLLLQLSPGSAQGQRRGSEQPNIPPSSASTGDARVGQTLSLTAISRGVRPSSRMIPGSVLISMSRRSFRMRSTSTSTRSSVTLSAQFAPGPTLPIALQLRKGRR